VDEASRPCRMCGTPIPKPTTRGAWAKSCSDGCRKAYEKARYQRRYAEDPQYFKDQAQRWQAQNRDRYRARKRQHNAEHPEIVRARNHRYYEQNQERLKSEAQAYRQRTDYYRSNRAEHARRKKAWYAANPGASAEHQRRRRARKLATGLVVFDPALLAAKLAYWGYCCWMCGGEPTGWDHVKPLSKGGPHILANLRPACQSCNSTKHNRWPYAVEGRVRPWPLSPLCSSMSGQIRTNLNRT